MIARWDRSPTRAAASRFVRRGIIPFILLSGVLTARPAKVTPLTGFLRYEGARQCHLAVEAGNAPAARYELQEDACFLFVDYRDGYVQIRGTERECGGRRCLHASSARLVLYDPMGRPLERRQSSK